MRLEKEASFSSKVGLIQLIATVIIYSVLVLLGQRGLTFLGSWQFSFSAFIPIVAGILFGLPGALGSALGAMLNYEGNLDQWYFMLAEGLLSFLLGYATYRLWYGYQSKKATLYIYNNRTFVKFTKILLFNAFNAAVLFGIQMKLQTALGDNLDIGIRFFNIFELSALLGVPLILLWDRNTSVEYYRPMDKASGKGYYRQAGMTLLTIECGYLILNQLEMVTHSIAVTVLLSGLFLWLYIATIPSTYNFHHEEKDGFNSLSAVLTMKLLLGADILVLCFAGYTLYEDYELISLLHSNYTWFFILGRLFNSVIIVLAGVYYILKISEKNMTQPIKQLSIKASNYLQTGELLLEAQAGAQNVETLSAYNEIDLAQVALGKMSRDISEHLEHLEEAVSEKQNVASQVEIASIIQQGVLPKLQLVNKQLSGYRVAGDMRAARMVGGDMYECFRLDEEHLLVMVADVSGKGIPAALFMMITQALVKQNALLYNPGRILEQTNNALAKRNEQGMFVTMWLGILELKTGKMTYANAGHNPPLLKNPKDASAQWIDALSGLVLGLMEDMEYENYELTLDEGGKLFLYTDGFNEAENASEEFFGNERLQQAFVQAGSAKEIVDAVEGFVQDATQSDDMTYLWLQREAREVS
ncbi:MAG: PP2C family protein-serine/threonine phosphatase [Phascolarctobacterium sp.]